MQPSSLTIRLNQTQQFTATVTNAANSSVTWRVNDFPGGNTSVGTISSTGIYTAPAAVPSPAAVVIKAVSVANPAQSATAAVTVALPVSDNYPRASAGSILRTTSPLGQIPLAGSLVAVLDWTAKDSSGTEEDILAACHALNVSGIPHVHTTTVAEAAGYPMLLVAGSPETFTSADRTALVDYVQGGGTLLLWKIADSTLLVSFGISASTPHSGTTTRTVNFDAASSDPVVSYIDDSAEIRWPMEYPDTVNTRGYTPATAVTLASWDTGDAAVLRADLGTGRAYVFGWRLRQVLTAAERRIVYGPEPSYTDSPVLDADICRLLVRGIYEGHVPDPRVRQFAPGGKHAALILTHDVDAQTSYDHIPDFVAFEQQRGVTSTFTLTTSAYSNGWIGADYNAASISKAQQARAAGFDIESHSFGHFPDFSSIPFGTGSETAANYFPQYSPILAETIGATLLGETGVSRWLLEADLGATVESFRAGHLDIPAALPQVLSQTGYRRDSSYAGGLTRGSFPYATFEVSNGVVSTYPVLEYPLVLSDHELTDATVEQVVSQWEQFIRLNYWNNAPTVLLIHPSSPLALKTAALQQLLDRVAELDLWVGDWRTFAEFWEQQGVTCTRWP